MTDVLDRSPKGKLRTVGGLSGLGRQIEPSGLSRVVMS